MRHREIPNDEIKHYLSIISSIVQSYVVKTLFDDNMRDRIFHFFCEKHKDFTLLEFKRICGSLLFLRLHRNSDLLNQFDAAYKEKFV